MVGHAIAVCIGAVERIRTHVEFVAVAEATVIKIVQQQRIVDLVGIQQTEKKRLGEGSRNTPTSLPSPFTA